MRHKQRLPFTIVHEDRDVLVIDKPPGLLSSSGARDRRVTAWGVVQDYLAATDRAARPGLIHRLDRDASGLLVFSKNSSAYRSLKSQFFHHTVTRAYAAVVHGKINPAKGRIESRLIERVDGTVRSTGRGGQRAITDYETIESNKSFSLLRVTLLTGRKHQIRVQLSEREHPIVGDAVYGSSDKLEPLRLTAIELQFDHPTNGERVTFKREIPWELPRKELKETRRREEREGRREDEKKAFL
ncbi:MAG: RluA family pseudouridine synthase [Phycisphaerae bacterium]|nr:RluA family pseudouridine synthase [Phycisphaerae bacterium]